MNERPKLLGEGYVQVATLSNKGKEVVKGAL